MIVVRTDDAGEEGYKVFATRRGAQAHFARELREVYEGAYQRVAVYEVPGAMSEGLAIEAVRSADPSIRLIRVEESDVTRRERLVRDIAPTLDIDL